MAVHHELDESGGDGRSARGVVCRSYSGDTGAVVEYLQLAQVQDVEQDGDQERQAASRHLGAKEPAAVVVVVEEGVAAVGIAADHRRLYLEHAELGWFVVVRPADLGQDCLDLADLDAPAEGRMARLLG